MSQIYQYLLSWVPSGLAIAILGLFALLVILLVLRIVKIVLDSLPFL